MQDLLRQRKRTKEGDPDDPMVRDMTEFAEAAQEANQTMTMLLAGIAAVSLIVGGIGIMNIMLVSVTERTREIGIRMAVGAKGRHVLLQFLLEAMVLTMIGGLVGVGLGTGAAKLFSELMEWPTQLGLESYVIAVSLLDPGRGGVRLLPGLARVAAGPHRSSALRIGPMLTRVLDLAVLALLRRGGAAPAARREGAARRCELDPERRLRVAELEATLAADPGEPAASLELCRPLPGRPPPRLGAGHRDRRPSTAPPPTTACTAGAALALADHFEAGAGLSGRGQGPGPLPVRLRRSLQRPRTHAASSSCTTPWAASDDIDMRQNPNAARERIMKALRPAYIPKAKEK